ncbi:MAG: GTPase Era [Acidimicrobiia bacterium]|nr:GTPase Era [Acidimicrobiia bacterium]
MRSGFVPIVGRPNVGKSTLTNALVGSKISIISKRPQTTRNTIRGVVTGMEEGVPAYQLVLVDTPGIHKPRTELGTRLNSLVYGTLAEADVVAFVIDATQPIGPGDRLIAERLRQAKAETVVVVSKTDVARKANVVEQLTEAAEWGFEAYVPVSALQGQNLEPLVAELVGRLPEGPLYFDPDTVSDQPDLDLAAELIREKFLDRLRDELPHSVVVVVDDMAERDDELAVVAARVIVERHSQRGIVIGKGGEMLKTVGTEARHELESLFGTRIHLDLRVVVEPDWQRRPQLLDRLGFGASGSRSNHP